MIKRQEEYLSILGSRFGKLLTIEFVGKNERGNKLIKCQCDCGNETIATYSHLLSGNRTSCGCHHPGQLRHGMTKTRTHNIWLEIKRRCYDPKHISYGYCGARGIAVCDRWMEFDNFFSDMGECPKGMSIDRIDNSKGYEPSNCRWATPKQQTENRSVQKFYEIDGETMTLPDVAKKYGINYRTLRNRMFRTGMTLEQAVVHKFGEITDKGMQRLKAAVSGPRKTTASRGVR